MIINELEKAFSKLMRPTPSELKAALASLHATKDQIAPYVLEPTDQLPYGRRVLFRTEEVEIVLIHLPPGQQSHPHDHGQSYGWEYVIQGELHNITYMRQPGGGLDVDETTVILPGEYCFIEQGRIHAICNKSSTPVIALNAYTPPLSGCTMYKAPQNSPK